LSGKEKHYAGVAPTYDPASREIGKLAKLKLPADYSKPTVLEGPFGARAASTLKLRLGFS
jgi:hypothetical protein